MSIVPFCGLDPCPLKFLLARLSMQIKMARKATWKPSHESTFIPDTQSSLSGLSLSFSKLAVLRSLSCRGQGRSNSFANKETNTTERIFRDRVKIVHRRAWQCTRWNHKKMATSSPPWRRSCRSQIRSTRIRSGNRRAVATRSVGKLKRAQMRFDIA